MEWIDGERLRTASTSDNIGRVEGEPRGSADDLALVEVRAACKLRPPTGLAPLSLVPVDSTYRSAFAARWSR